MAVHAIVLFFHVTAVLVLSAALSFEALSLFRLRRASTLAEAKPWLEPVPRLPTFAIVSLLVILFTGIHLVIEESATNHAWGKVAAATLLFFPPFGALSTRRMREIRQTAQTASANSAELLARLRDPFLRISLGVRLAAFLGIFMLVNVKPGLPGAIGIVGTSLSLGFLFSVFPLNRTESLPAGNASAGD